MKTITVINPNNELLTVMNNTCEKWVCPYDNNSYREVTGDVDESIKFKLVGACPASFGHTIRVDTDFGKALDAAMSARFAVEHWGTDEMVKELTIAEKTLELVERGQTYEMAKRIATNLSL